MGFRLGGSCSPCCSTTPQPAPCPVDPDLITAVEVDLRSGGLFQVLSAVGDGVVVFETDFSSMTGTYSLTETKPGRWTYHFPPRFDGGAPFIEFSDTGNWLRFCTPPIQDKCKTYNGTSYTNFWSCWKQVPGDNCGTIWTNACERTYPVVAWNSALVEGQYGYTTNLNAGTGGYAQARQCPFDNYLLIPWTSTGRTGDPNIYFDAIRIYI